MQVGKGSTAPVVVEQVLQMKSLQFPKLVLMPEQWICTQLWHTLHGNVTDAIFDFGMLSLEQRLWFFQHLGCC